MGKHRASQNAVKIGADAVRPALGEGVAGGALLLHEGLAFGDIGARQQGDDGFQSAAGGGGHRCCGRQPSQLYGGLFRSFVGDDNVGDPVRAPQDESCRQHACRNLVAEQAILARFAHYAPQTLMQS